MITLRKLQKLPDMTRRRKYAVILQQIEDDLNHYIIPEAVYIKGLLKSIGDDSFFSEDLRARAIHSSHETHLADQNSLLRTCNSIRHGVLQALGAEPADWDFISTGESHLSKFSGEREIYPLSLYLDDLRSPFNIGSIFRSAESFGIEKIYLSPGCPSPLHKRSVRAAMGCIERVSWEVCSLDQLQGPVFALECGGRSLKEFPFPVNGTAIIGSEELGISPQALKLVEGSLGKVTIPLYGLKGSINVSVAAGIMMNRWMDSVV